MADLSPLSASSERSLYVPVADVEDLKEYTIGGYHPTKIGDRFSSDRYTVVHKLGFGGYSTVWLVRDESSSRYVALKILVADASPHSTEGTILQRLTARQVQDPGQRFLSRLLAQFSFAGPNGHHVCFVQEAAGCSVALARECSPNFMFPPDAARSIAAQLILGVSYIHSQGVCHGDLHPRNFLLKSATLDGLAADDLYKQFPLDTARVKRADGGCVEPHAPTHAVYPMTFDMPADRLRDPVIQISDYGASFLVESETPQYSHAPPLYSPPEALFGEFSLPTSGRLVLYEVLGERTLLETFSGDRDDVIADMVSTCGKLPDRWWNKWWQRKEFFTPDGEWLREIQRIYTPGDRPLGQRLWDMGRGETEETCQWDVQAGEMDALKKLLEGMLMYEPDDRLKAEQLLESEYMVHWAKPAWERQQDRRRGHAQKAKLH